MRRRLPRHAKSIFNHNLMVYGAIALFLVLYTAFTGDVFARAGTIITEPVAQLSAPDEQQVLKEQVFKEGDLLTYHSLG